MPVPPPEVVPLPGFVATVPQAAGLPRQASFDDLGTPLCEVTFVVVDLETTGAAPGADAITEIGALKLRGGELLGTFDTLVNPGVPIPPMITVLTGITEAMVFPAPAIDEVLPAFLEFLGDAVVVGHNVRFDVSFLDAALEARGYSRLANRRVDTLGLARRLLRDEVPNCKLDTLARHLRAPTAPSHRAFSDASATAEVFHSLLERAGCLGVLGLDDLLALPGMRAHPSVGKLSLTARLPREPGVYLFRDRDGRVLYVGKATNLRSRVRSYFSGDTRRKVPQLLRETTAIEHFVCREPLEAAVREVRLIQELQPRFNRQGKAWRQYAYLKLTDERFPRLAMARVVRPGDVFLGPLGSASAAHAVREAIETAVPLRRCTRRIGRNAVADTGPPCVPAQLGVASCPCRGHVDDTRYGEIVDVVRRGITAEPHLLLDPLTERMRRLAGEERFEEAAASRDRLAALVRVLRRRRLVQQVRAAGRLVVEHAGGELVLDHGRLVLDGGPGARPLLEQPPDLTVPPGRDEVDELLLVARWLEQSAGSVALVGASGTFASELPGLPSYGTRAGSRSSRA